MDIGQTIQALRDGRKVARAGWNGKGMWLKLRRPDTSGTILGDVEMSVPFVYMCTVQRDLVPWLCSQTDLLADDWEIVE